MRTTGALALLATVLLAGCEGDHLAFCGEQDGNGWRLVDYQRDDSGNLIACTYEAPDGSDSYTARP